MRIRAFIAQHKSEKISECQDRFAINTETRSMAVSDGISQSIFPDYWANLLAQHYVNFGKPTEEDRLNLCKQWREMVMAFIEEERKNGRDPWRAESNLYEGISAGATLCGIVFGTNGEWTCDVLGDSCLVYVTKDEQVLIYSSEEKEFDTYPDYLDSNPKRAGRGEFKSFSGVLTDSECLLLVSDPFSGFLSESGENSIQYIRELTQIENHDDYVNLVEKWRKLGMHNDDSTVIIIEHDSSDTINLAHIDSIEDMIAEEQSLEQMTQESDVFDSEVLKTDAEEKLEMPTEDTEEIPNLVNDGQAVQNETASDENTPGEENGNHQTFSALHQEMLDAIPGFVDDFVGSLRRKKSHPGFASITRFIFKRNKTKADELKALVSLAITRYVEKLFHK